MRRIICCLLFVLGVILLTSCGQELPSTNEPITLFPPHTETVSESPVETSPDGRAVANKTYGQTTAQEPVGFVTDNCELYRSDVSYALESVALEKAKALFAETVSRPETLSVLDVQLLICAEDKDNAYYLFYMNAAYYVETGEQISRSEYIDVGVRQADKTAFDAKQTISDAIERYSIYSDTIVFAVISQADPDTPDFEDGAMQIAVAQLKDPQAGKAVRAVRRDELCNEPEISVYDVLCVGVNDFGDTIPSVYTVYMTFDGKAVVQQDPMKIHL